MKNTLILLSPKFLSIKNSIRLRLLMRKLLFPVMGLAFWALLYLGTYEILSFIKGVEIFGDIISMKLLAVIFFSLTGFLLLSNTITAVSAFYLSKDIMFLLSKPVETKDILRLKTATTIAASSWMVVSFIPPVFIAYGVIYSTTWKFYAALLFAFIPFILIPAGVGISLAHLLAKIFSVKKTKEVLLVLGLVLFLLIYFLLRSIASVSIDNPEDLINTLISFKTDFPFLPGYWMTYTLSPLLKGRPPDLLYPFLLISNGAFFILVSETIGGRLYRNNLDKMHSSAKKTKRRMVINYPPAHGAVLWKDAKIFFRDTEQWSQLFIIIALVMIYVYNFKVMPIKALTDFTPFLREMVVMINMVLAGLVLSAVSARFLYTSISLEGGAFWVIKSSPFATEKFLWNKFLYGFIPVTTIISTIVVLTNIMIGINGFLMYLSLGTVLLLSLSVSGLGTGLGAAYPKFKFENVASVSMSPGSVVFMLIAFCVVLATVSLEAWPVYLFKKAGGLPGFFEYSQAAVSVVLITTLNTLAFYLPMRAGKKRLERDLFI